MEKRIIFATGNQNKMKEIHMILADLRMPIYSMKEAGIDIDIVEDGTTFEENAQIKAKAIAKYLPDDIILADDSGLRKYILTSYPHSAFLRVLKTPENRPWTLHIPRLTPHLPTQFFHPPVHQRSKA